MMIATVESQTKIVDRLDCGNPGKTYRILFDWANGRIVLDESTGTRMAVVLASGLLSEDSIEIEIRLKVKDR